MYVDYVRVYQNKDKSYTKPKPRKIVTSDKLDTFGVQLNKKDAKVNFRSFVEPDIRKKTISTYGMVFGIKSINGKDDTGITQDDLIMENDDTVIQVFQNDSQDMDNLEIQKSETATYYNTDLEFLDGFKKHKNEVIWARPYTIMEDGQYIYGKVKEIDLGKLK